MSIYDDKYDIRLAKYEEIPEIMDFIGTYWKKGHILSRDRKFFEYEMVIDGQVNFIIAKERATGQISGLKGFLKASRDIGRLDSWGCMWKVKPNSIALLGVELVKRTSMLTGSRGTLSIGGNPNTTIPILKKIFKFQNIGKMKHFYCLAIKGQYEVAIVKNLINYEVNNKYISYVKKLDSYEMLVEEYDTSYGENAYPYKDLWYIKHRYYDHPIYKYSVFGLFDVKDSKKVEALLICREQEYKNTKVLRIVDYMGRQDLFRGLSWFFKDKLTTYEYIDFYCYGFNYEYILEAGMTELVENDDNIIPNYFSPYVEKNIDIWVGSMSGNPLFFKADGDQDRPS